MTTALFYIFIALCAYLVYKNRRKLKSGVISLPNNRKFPYVLGDYLISEDNSFNGIDITLPKSLANFYLDGHATNKYHGSNVLFDNSQKLALEGDFNKYFQLFVPKGSATLVLSIISPDLMQLLINYIEHFDVELIGNHLHVLTTKKVYGNNVETELLAVSQALLVKIDNRSANWQQGPTPLKLKYRNGATWTIAGRYVRRSRATINMLYILAGIVAIGAGLAIYYTSKDPHFTYPYTKGFFAGTMMYAAEYIIFAAIIVIPLFSIIWFFLHRPDKEVFSSK